MVDFADIVATGFTQTITKGTWQQRLYAPWGVEVDSKVVQVHIAMVLMLTKRLIIMELF